MSNVAGQHNEAGILKMNQQRLVAGGVPWRRDQSDAPIAEYIGITVDELKVLRRAHELTRQRHQLIYVVVRPVGGMYPAVLGMLHHDCGVGEQSHVAGTPVSQSSQLLPRFISQQVEENSILRPTFSPGVHTDSSFARERPQSNRKSFSATPALMASGSVEPAHASGTPSIKSEKAT